MRGGFPLNATVLKTAMVNADVGMHHRQMFVDDVGGKLPQFRHFLRAGFLVIEDARFLAESLRANSRVVNKICAW